MFVGFCRVLFSIPSRTRCTCQYAATCTAAGDGVMPVDGIV